jgi:hypothetical protein
MSHFHLQGLLQLFRLQCLKHWQNTSFLLVIRKCDNKKYYCYFCCDPWGIKKHKMLALDIPSNISKKWQNSTKALK